MTDRTIVRVATTDDAEALADVYVSSARHHVAIDPEFYVVPDREVVAKDLRGALGMEDEGRVVRLVAEVDGSVVGSATVELRRPNAASMLAPQLAASVGVAVLEDRRGGGIGSRLMEAAEDWARQRGATLMMLDASAANAEAVRFYEERHGYRPRGVLLTKRVAPVDRGRRKESGHAR